MSEDRADETRLIIQDVVETPVGRLKMSSFLAASYGIAPSHPRVLGSYAIVWVLAGDGFFREGGNHYPVRAGDLLLLFPERAHTYGAAAGATWSEFFVVFDGPVFDFWREAGLLGPARPLRHLELEKWRDKVEAWAALAGHTAPAVLVGHFLALLTEMLADTSDGLARDDDWLLRARALLDADLNQEIDLAHVARQVGLSYESFRKRFVAATGMAPARYRAERRIAAACALLRYTETPNKAIAASLGFADEFHFGKRFKQIMGQTPRQFWQHPSPP